MKGSKLIFMSRQEILAKMARERYDPNDDICQFNLQYQDKNNGELMCSLVYGKHSCPGEKNCPYTVPARKEFIRQEAESD